jgi:stage V sporulation protein D (sporulation-specific penicillin-binding protein)
MRRGRKLFIFSLFIICGLAIAVQLFRVQIIKGDYYKALVKGRKMSNYYLSMGERGEVFFKGGEAFALNAKCKRLFIFPLKIKDKEAAIKALSSILQEPESDIRTIIEGGEVSSEVKKILSKGQEDSLLALNDPGISLQDGVYREYPQKEMASRVIGFLGGEERGQYGIEGYYDDSLQGKEAQSDEGGDFLSSPSQKGNDMVLNVDYNIQFFAEEMLKQAKTDYDIESGQIIVVEPTSGRVLALAEFPSFDPNNYSKEKDYQIFQNSLVQKIFEPGSIFKPITMASAIDQGKIDPQTKYIDKGILKIGGWTINNYANRTYGELTMTQVLEKSVNTGAVFAQKSMGNELFLEYLKRFGFFEPTGIDVQGEIYSENKEVKSERDINCATAAFGQGIEVTPIQMVRAFCAIANGGKLVKPLVTEKINNSNGKVEEIKEEISSRQVISQETASKVTNMMVSVIENGFSKKAKVPGYFIAGKTGTAQIPFSALGINERGYSDKTWQTFMGFGPAYSPKFLILVKLDNPNTKTAEYSALPIFKELAKYVIDYLQIPPDRAE